MSDEIEFKLSTPNRLTVIWHDAAGRQVVQLAQTFPTVGPSRLPLLLAALQSLTQTMVDDA